MKPSGEINGRAESPVNGGVRAAKTPAPPTGDVGARVRRHRGRRRQGIRHVAMVEIHAESLAALIKAGWLDKAEAEDREIVGDALQDLIDCYARGVLSPDPGPTR